MFSFEYVVVVVSMAEMVEKLSRHHSGIPVKFDGVLEHLLILLSFCAYQYCLNYHSFSTTQEARTAEGMLWTQMTFHPPSPSLNMFSS
jgi:hypothetical protein